MSTLVPPLASAQEAKKPSPVVKTGFERFELKFWVPEIVARELVAFASPYLEIDEFSVPGLGQCNTSLYFDTPDLLFARLHISSSPDRYKLRIRRYGNPASGPGFFEIKRKIKHVILKRRAVVPWQYAPELIDGTFSELPPLKSSSERQSLEAFLYAMTVHGAEPKVLIRAYREAFAPRDAMEDVRMTLDRQIVYQPARGLEFDLPERCWIPIDRFVEHGFHRRRVLVELKFRGMAPWWMSEIVHRLDMWRVGYSKYISSILREVRDFAAVPGWAARRS